MWCDVVCVVRCGMCGVLWYVAKRVVRCVCGMCGEMWCDAVSVV